MVIDRTLTTEYRRKTNRDFSRQKKIFFRSILNSRVNILKFYYEISEKTTDLRDSARRSGREDASLSTDSESSSEKEHKVNALALGADEGRDKLR